MASKQGGKRTGAGRPTGSTNRVRISDIFTAKEQKDFWADLKMRAKTSEKIAIYFAEQLTGKAAQAIDHTTNGKDIPTPMYGGKAV